MGTQPVRLKGVDGRPKRAASLEKEEEEERAQAVHVPPTSASGSRNGGSLSRDIYSTVLLTLCCVRINCVQQGFIINIRVGESVSLICISSLQAAIFSPLLLGRLITCKGSWRAAAVVIFCQKAYRVGLRVSSKRCSMCSVLLLKELSLCLWIDLVFPEARFKCLARSYLYLEI